MTISEWITNYRNTLNFNINLVTLSILHDWKLLIDRSEITRYDRTFFTIIGVLPNIISNGINALPLINQPEIGILGFLISQDEIGKKILLHAKSEPGNINVTQIGPTVQATESNYNSKHGGKSQAFINFFLDDSCPKTLSIKQSEQGNRFLNKYNLNVVVEVGDFKLKNEEKFKWFYIEEIIANLNQPYLFNTDFKSVFSHLLESILIDIPLHKRDTPFLNSYFNNTNSDFNSIIEKVNTKRKEKKFSISNIKLDQLQGWELDATGIIPKDKSNFGYHFFKIEINDREVAQWEQPLITKESTEKIELLCFEQNGELLFIFNEKMELGFKNIIQLAPSIQYDFLNNSDKPGSQGKPIIQFSQSEEGGRFYKNISEYQVTMVDSNHRFTTRSDYQVLNLYQICQLLKIEGIFTNEARNIIASFVGFLK